MVVFFKYIFFAGMILAEVIRFPHRARVSRARRENRMVVSQVKGSESAMMTFSFVGMYVLPLVYIFSNWLGFADYTLPNGAGWLGVVLLAVALLMIWRAHKDLGKNWSPSLEVVQEQRLITHGIYHYFRHPIYTAMLLFAVAQALLLHNWIAGLVGSLAFVPLYVLRLPREEEMMLEQFGDEYRQYMKRTGRLFPRIFR